MDAAQRAGAADLASLEVLQVGGAKLSAEVARRIAPVLGCRLPVAGCRLPQVFGMAEGLVNYTRADDPDEIVETTQRRPISEDDEVRVVDEHDVGVPDGVTGQLLTRGPYTIRGYFRADAHNATAFTADGFYRTGDLVRRLPVLYTAQPGGQSPTERGLLLDFWGPGVPDDAYAAAIVDRLTPAPGDHVVTKHRYSAFEGSNFAHLLGRPDRAGVVTTTADALDRLTIS